MQFIKRFIIEMFMLPVRMFIGIGLVMMMVVGETWCNIVED